jgi:histidinol-phosphate aminotransferase
MPTTKLTAPAHSAEGLISRWLRPEIRALSAYHVPDRAELMLLDAMENPYPWPGKLQQQWLERLKSAQINRYPDPQARALKTRLRETFGIPRESEILLGNGSDELIQLVALAVTQPARCILAPEPSFVMYRMIAVFAGMDFVGVDLNSDFSLDIEAMKRLIREREPALIFIAYPNNPTGNCWPRADIEALIGLAPGLVVIDEAYEPFAQKSFLDVLPKHPNLLVMRTMSKLGLAGLRLGYLCGAPEWTAEFDKLRLPYNISTLTQMSAAFALEHIAELRVQAAEIRAGRVQLIAGLNELPGMHAFASDANFVLFRTPQGRASALHQGLLARGILVKNLSRQGILADCLRVTVGSPQEQTRFLEALNSALKD